MPALVISTNLSRSKIPDDFLSRMVNVLATTLSKPLEYCAVQILPDQLMQWGSSSEPCANITLTSIGKLGIEENKKHANAIMSLVNELGIPSDRMYITFNDAAASDIGYNNSTFHGIL